MGNYTGGARAKCPYYLKEADKSITCEGLIPSTVTMIRFASIKAKQFHQRNHCEQYDPEKGCPIAALLNSNDADSVQNDAVSVIGGMRGGGKANIGSRIRALRRTQGISQSELAASSYVSRSYIGDIETGRKNPCIDTLALLAEALDVEVSTLLGEKRKV
jgi:DNA-binding XRE family transcriptional regulator